jgi:antitoxin component YwqK of YwqJK toxin-antitoxin module
MFRAFLFLFFICSFVSVNAFTVAQDSSNRTDPQGRKQGYWIKSEEGRKKYEGQFRNDKPFGKFTYYHTNGKVKAITNYSLDGQIARTKMFDTDGLLEAEGKFLDKQKDSTWIFYFKGGATISSTEEWKNGKKDGMVKTYYPSGKLSTECPFVNDQPHGLCKEYFTTGTIKKEYTYEHGLLEGTFKIYHLNGLPDAVGKYQKSLKVGDWVEYLENGKIKTRRTFRGGILYKESKENGKFTDYYDDGIPKLEVEYKDGKKNGPFREYYDVGQFKHVQKAVQNEEMSGGSAETVEVLEGQKLKTEGAYVNDKLDGKITTYDEKGKVVKTENYKEGVIIK